MLTFEEFLIEQELDVEDARSLLGLPVGFSPDELKAAYHKAAKQNHPDSGGSGEVMKQINAAYSKLKTLGPDSVVAPSITNSEITASSNDPDLQYKRMRAARRAELLSKSKR